MIAYNHEWLDNLTVEKKLEQAYHENFISKKEFDDAIKVYPADFYSPNIFIRIGLFILTVIIVGFTLGLFALFFASSSTNGFGSLLIFLGFVCYGSLELLVRNRHHYRSGADDALLFMSGAFIVGGANLVSNISFTGNSVLIFVIALYFLLRFSDTFMSAIATLALLSLSFFVYIKLGNFAKATTPFLLMIISVLIYYSINKISLKKTYKNYDHCFTVIKVVALLCFYAAGNYFVVREASIAMFDLNLKNGESIPYGWLVWIFTFLIPAIYILRGIQMKDIIRLRVGLLLVAAIIFTVRYYHPVVPLEIAMTVGGIIMIFISYFMIKYLKQPKNGFTSEEIKDVAITGKLNLEGLIIAETFGHSQQSSKDSLFGGGTGGGGGASGEF